jgi:hypothetical protein
LEKILIFFSLLFFSLLFFFPFLPPLSSLPHARSSSNNSTQLEAAGDQPSSSSAAPSLSTLPSLLAHFLLLGFASHPSPPLHPS